MHNIFRKISTRISLLVGSPYTFLLAIFLITLWAVSGKFFGYSDTWQLVINTSTTIVTFLMVFLIQNTQNRDAKAIHIKLDELLRAEKGARTQLVNLEDVSDEELESLHQEFRQLHDTITSKLERIESMKSKKKTV